MDLKKEQRNYFQFVRRLSDLKTKSIRGWMNNFFDAITDEYRHVDIDQLKADKVLEDYSDQTIPCGSLVGLYRPDLYKFYKGERLFPKWKAAELYKMIDQSRFEELIPENEASIDAVIDMSDKLEDYGITIPEGTSIAFVMTHWLLRILWDIAGEELSDSDRRHKDLKRQQTSTPTGNVYIKDGKLFDERTSIPFPPDITKPSAIQRDEIPYATKILEAYADHDKCDPVSIDKVENLSPIFTMHFEGQRDSFFKAISRERQIREIRPDGLTEFNQIKELAYSSIFETYLSDYPDGYARLNATVTQAGNAPLDGSVLTKIPSLFDVPVKKGLVHLLVNEGRIKGWVL